MTDLEIIADRQLIPSEIIKKLLWSGCKFQYESYDFRKAHDEYKEDIFKKNDYNTWTAYQLGHTDIPTELKEKYLILRIGKLRQINFRPDGEIFTVYIGNKRSKRFFLSDFGKEVKPIIFKSDDEYDLIGQGLAIADKL